MADELERSVRSIEGQSPSPDFVSDLRQQLLAEVTAMSAEGHGDVSVVDLDRVSEKEGHQMTRKRWMFAGAAAAIALFGGIFALSVYDDDEEAVTATDVSVTSADPAVTTTVEPDLPVLPREFGPIANGTYRVDRNSMAFVLTIDTPVWLQDNRAGFVALSRSSSEGPGDLDIGFMQLTKLWDPGQPDVSIRNQGDAWPADDFAGWLDNLPEEVIVSNREETTVGGRPAIRADLALGEVECVEQDPYCVGVAMSGSTVSGLVPGGTIRVWVIDRGDTTVAVIASVLSDEDLVWFESADALVASISFEDE